MSNLTPLGKYLRKLRKDKGERLYDLAKVANVSCSYLSAVETGLKKASAQLLQAISSHYRFDIEQQKILQRLADLSVPSVTIDMRNLSEEDRKLCLFVAEQARGMDPEVKDRLFNIFREATVN